MRRAFLLSLGSLTTCGPPAPAEPQAEGTTASTSATPTSGSGGGSSSSESSSGAVSTSTTGAAEGVTFIPDPDIPADPAECDNWAQDCPPGDKCSAYANDGGSSWNAVKCVPVMENPAQPGEPCFVGNAVSGIDNCDLGAYCWDTDAENQGTCVALCTGTPEAPVCEPNFACAIVNDGILNLCLDACHPLMDDCPGDDHCIPTPNDDGFLCVLDVQNSGGVHEPCYFPSNCDHGLVCIEPDFAVECDQTQDGCCAAFCDLTLPNTCTGQGQECRPWFEPPDVPEGYEYLGYCAVPA